MQQMQITKKEQKEISAEQPVGQPKAPMAKFSVGGIQAALWANEGKEGASYFTVTMDKRYKSGEQWKSTKSLRVGDLPKAILVLQKAYEHLALKEVDS